MFTAFMVSLNHEYFSGARIDKDEEVFYSISYVLYKFNLIINITYIP